MIRLVSGFNSIGPHAYMNKFFKKNNAMFHIFVRNAYIIIINSECIYTHTLIYFVTANFEKHFSIRFAIVLHAAVNTASVAYCSTAQWKSCSPCGILPRVGLHA